MYNKLFQKILDSSIWLEDMPTRLVWVTFLAAMDEDGFVSMASPSNLAHRAVVPLEDCKRALDRLEGPDPDSSDPENDGRRVERVPGGWMVLNAKKYRDLVTREQIKGSTRERVRRHRQRNGAVTPCNADSVTVTQCNDSVTSSEADTGADTGAGGEAPRRPPSPQASPVVLPPPQKATNAGRELLDILRANGCKLELGAAKLLPEWFETAGDLPLEWIAIVIRKRKAKLPSDLRKGLKEMEQEFGYWKATRKGASGP